MPLNIYTVNNSHRYIQSIDSKPILMPSKGNQSKIRTLSRVGSASYVRARRRAFARAKLIAFFNPDMNTFITLTYAGVSHTDIDVIDDIKYLIKKTKRHTKDPVKYIWVMEYQKRGSIHVHMVANNVFRLKKNKNGYDELVDWSHGFSSVLQINVLDSNFKPYLYLFKYMSKSQRIGSSFIHTSRNFDKIEKVPYSEYITKLKEGNVLFEEDIEYYIGDEQHRIIKRYFSSS